MKINDCIRVLVVDDHPVVREGIAALLGRADDMEVVAEAGSGQEAIALFQRYRPDVLLLDLRMPGMDGVAVIAQIRQETPDARIIVLTAYESEEDIYRGLQAGARGYLLKDTASEELLEAIRAVYKGQTRIPSNVAAKLAQRISQQPLTPRERDVLRLMVAGKSNQEIALALFIAEGTVKVHVNSILDKMNVNDRTQAVTAALRRGLVHLN